MTLGSGHKQRHLGSSHGVPLDQTEGALPVPTQDALRPASVSPSSPWFSLPTDVRACTSTPCANNGTCVNLDNGQYECSCAPGFSGKDCQKKDGPCVMNG